MSLFGTYAFAEAAYSDASFSVIVDVTGAQATFFAIDFTTVVTGSRFTVDEISGMQTAFNNDETLALGSAIVPVICTSDTFQATLTFSGGTRIFNSVFAMTPERYLAYPKTITQNQNVVGVNDAKVSASIVAHLEYVIDNRPGVYDGEPLAKTYKNIPMDPNFIGWIKKADILSPFRVSVGNLTKANRTPVGLIPRGAPAQADIDIIVDYYNGVTLAPEVYDRVQQLIWGVPNEFFENARTYTNVTNSESQTYSEETPNSSNIWNDLVI